MGAGPSPASPAVLQRVTLPTGTGLGAGASYRPFQFQQTITATDLNNTNALIGLDSNVTYGDAATAGTGTAHALTGDILINGQNTTTEEFAVLAGSIKFAGNPFPFATPGRMWLTDLRGHGPIGIQPNLLSGENVLLNNYYNGTPTRGSAGISINTYPGIGSGAPQNAALNYPIDAGLVIAGAAGDPAGTKNSRQGFTTGIRLGGAGVAWDGIASSRIGTGISMTDYETAGIVIGAPFTAATPIGINITGATLTYGIDLKSGTYTANAAIRLPNTGAIVWRNVGDSADVNGISMSSSVVTISTSLKASNVPGIGFYGTAATAKQTVTGSKGANAALTSLMTALATIGLVTDSTT